MAQFMNSRERRACLAALAELAKDGAKGILTSRPNYFSESEELNVFEALYRSLEQNSFALANSDAAFVLEEKNVDSLIERYVLNRYERALQDLTPQQTESLVKRILKNNVEGQKIVIAILQKVPREETQGARQSLSGKPIIIAYLLELVEGFQNDGLSISLGRITEWQIYTLIVDRLMLRDLRRSSLPPAERRRALQELAIRISTRDEIVASEEIFSNIIDHQFQSELRRLSPEEKRTRRFELFEDLRSSATLTRASGSKVDGWVFSHNSLREYMVAEVFISSLLRRQPAEIRVPISTAMRAFVASIDQTQVLQLWQALSELWPRRSAVAVLGPYLTLLWDSASRTKEGLSHRLQMLGAHGKSRNFLMDDLNLKELDFGKALKDDSVSVSATGSVIADCRFDGLNLSGSSFESCILDATSFRDCVLANSTFSGAYLFECDLSGADVNGSNFISVEKDSSIVIIDLKGNRKSLNGDDALGYLSFSGALTDPVDSIYVYRHHPKYAIIEKICMRISEQKNSQLRGLTQRGESRVDPPFARSFLKRLESLDWVSIDRHDVVSVTPMGRPIIMALASGEKIDQNIVEFIRM